MKEIIYNTIKKCNEIFGIIEISAFTTPIKYEINKQFNLLEVDRFLSVPMRYPCNYGFIPNTLGLDGDPIDLLIPTPHPVQPNTLIKCRPIGMLNMEDESGHDIKIIAVPHDKLTEEYSNIIEVEQLPKLLKKQIVFFFTNYKKLEPNKWVKIEEWKNSKEAIKEIKTSILRKINKN